MLIDLLLFIYVRLFLLRCLLTFYILFMRICMVFVIVLYIGLMLLFLRCVLDSRIRIINWSFHSMVKVIINVLFMIDVLFEIFDVTVVNCFFDVFIGLYNLFF